MPVLGKGMIGCAEWGAGLGCRRKMGWETGGVMAARWPALGV